MDESLAEASRKMFAEDIFRNAFTTDNKPFVQKMLNVWMNYYSDEQKDQLKIAGYDVE